MCSRRRRPPAVKKISSAFALPGFAASLLAALPFADLARRPLIVGGHMFSPFMPTVLHAFGETVNEDR